MRTWPVSTGFRLITMAPANTANATVRIARVSPKPINDDYHGKVNITSLSLEFVAEAKEAPGEAIWQDARPRQVNFC